MPLFYIPAARLGKFALSLFFFFCVSFSHKATYSDPLVIDAGVDPRALLYASVDLFTEGHVA